MQLLLDLGVKVKKKRVRYTNRPTYRKSYKNDVNDDGVVKDDSIWGQMHQMYLSIAGYCLIETFQRQEEVFEYQGLRVWHDIYTKGKYEYYGEMFEGQEFDDRFAEIIGTENWFIDKRLEAHKMLLTFLHSGREIKESVTEVLALMKGGINE